MVRNDLGLGATVRAWRDRLDPTAVGLSPDGARRALGLRREELASLTGISVDYLVRLEQGRADHPSPAVVAALGRALQLNGPERDHLYRLAHLIPPGPEEVSDEIPNGVKRVLSRLSEVAVGVFAADWQMIWWNHSWSSLVGDPAETPPPLRNFARDTFPTNGSRPGLCRSASTPGREALEIAVVSDLRRATGRFPHSSRLTSLIRHLTAGNPRFAALWESGIVGVHVEDHKIIDHPAAGEISVDCDILTTGDAEHKIVILTAPPDTEDDAKVRQVLQHS
ncbi:helix-turn-helix transcriptional regulator [Mycobacterium sp. HNNTM2301]|uniref:helix-turn-helix transcriptional regulator n=1 Tax=Mycobacterium hainanense TaxID=3289775 RepID=UPI0035A6AEC5